MPSCNNSNLTAYNPSSANPWDISKIKFIYRRLGFGISLEKAKTKLGFTPSELIDQIIDNAKNLPLTTAPEWGYWNNSQINQSGKNQSYYKNIWQRQAFSNFLNDGFRERITLFWSNHFVTEYYDYIEHLNYFNIILNFKNIHWETSKNLSVKLDWNQQCCSISMDIQTGNRHLMKIMQENYTNFLLWGREMGINLMI